jgi:hypothetical protein
MLADLLFEKGAPVDALKEYEAVMKMAPRRFNATAGATKAAHRIGDESKARSYAMQLREITRNAEVSRPDLDSARSTR